MSFLCELKNKKKKLRSCETIVTSSTGNKFLERKHDTGEIETVKLMETCPGYVVDEKLDLQIAEILEYLCLSSQDVAQDLALLELNGITHVLSLGINLPTSKSLCRIIFKKVEMLDEPTEDLTKVFNECFEFIECSQQENSNNKVLIHCNAGYSRAPTVIIGYLMKKYGYSLKESFNMVNQKRNIKPNAGFMEQLKMLERNLRI